MTALIEIFLLGLITAFFICVGPYAFIWAINTLVHAGGVLTFVIPFTFHTWFAALILGGLAIIPGLRRRT